MRAPRISRARRNNDNVRNEGDARGECRSAQWLAVASRALGDIERSISERLRRRRGFGCGEHQRWNTDTCAFAVSGTFAFAFAFAHSLTFSCALTDTRAFIINSVRRRRRKSPPGGPGKTYSVPSAAAIAAQNGDVIKISAGNYVGDVTTWSSSNLTICWEDARRFSPTARMRKARGCG